MFQVRGVAVRVLVTMLRHLMGGQHQCKALVTKGQGLSVSEKKSGLEGVDD